VNYKGYRDEGLHHWCIIENEHFFFGVMLGQLLFSHIDNLSRTIQKRDISAAGAQGVASMTLTTLEKIRNDTSFHLF